MIAMVNLQPVLDRSSARVQTNLDAMHRQGQYITGPQSRAFENEFAAFTGGHYGVGTGTGAAAIELCLREAGVVRPEQKVIVPSHTSMFTAHAVLAAGATPRIVDVDPETLLLDPATVARAWTPDVAAVVPVHLYGRAARLAELAVFCRDRGVLLVQDACQAHGALCDGHPLTHFSNHTAYSFYPTKNLGALGDGGAVVTANARIARRVRMLRDGGRVNDQIARAPGINSRLDELHCCYLRAFLQDLAHWNHHRARVAAAYDAALRGCPGIAMLDYPAGSVHHLYVIRVQNGRRAELQQKLLARGVQSGVHYPVPLHLQPGFRRRCEIAGPLPVSELAAAEVLSLPIGPHISVEDAERVSEAVREALA
jgi:dTDP-3-amino-3,4,6-trideoxy-alpha-D-glucose transaminase